MMTVLVFTTDEDTERVTRHHIGDLLVCRMLAAY